MTTDFSAPNRRTVPGLSDAQALHLRALALTDTWTPDDEHLPPLPQPGGPPVSEADCDSPWCAHNGFEWVEGVVL